MPSLEKRWKDLPADLNAPTRSGNAHRTREETWTVLRVIKRSPNLLREEVDEKRKLSGLAPVGSHKL